MKYIYIVLGDGCGPIFIFTKFSVFFHHFLCTSQKNVIMMKSFENMIKVNNKVLFTEVCSRQYPCFFRKFKHLLNIKAYLERNCTFFLFSSLVPSLPCIHYAITFFVCIQIEYQVTIHCTFTCRCQYSSRYDAASVFAPPLS